VAQRLRHWTNAGWSPAVIGVLRKGVPPKLVLCTLYVPLYT